MESILVVIAILSGTFLLAMAVDRGIPNMLDSFAYVLERPAAITIQHQHRLTQKSVYAGRTIGSMLVVDAVEASAGAD